MAPALETFEFSATDYPTVKPGQHLSSRLPPASLDGMSLEWMKDGERPGTGEILEGDALDPMAE
ncbi:hypothetical protein U879_06605 [Defluviimonas sp. 20V17]|uniref:Uncharacterized protein n=1 Tax=Allgaiera indica TaxID=765699 RepID=A0AAN5A1D4_9RHOB|nr:hypothetical protein U879_06605 [Defluviimonas sp. 20V17]GHE06212.1 hypothetical protein GCM10008024_39860 [Allgaiera indica]